MTIQHTKLHTFMRSKNTIFLMLSNYKVISISYKRLNVNELKKYVINAEHKKNFEGILQKVKSELHLDDFIYLNTCNRISYIMHTEQIVDESFIKKLFTIAIPDFDLNSFDAKFIEIIEGKEAVNHVLELASSLQSLVIGEREILKQFRKAYDQSHSMGLTGDNMRILSEFTIQTAKKVFSNTKISERPVSVVSLAMQKLLNSSITVKDRILMIGAGQTNKLVGKYLKKYGYTNVCIFNRNPENAKELAHMLHANYYSLDELANYKNGFDCIISCTASTSAIVSSELYELLLQKDGDKKVLFDLAVPNDIDKSIKTHRNVEIIDIEDLRNLAKANLKFRKLEITAAKKILRPALKSFQKLVSQRILEKTLAGVPTEMKAVKNRALHNVYKAEMAKLDEDTQKLIVEMMEYMEKKCVAVPMRIARQALN